MSESDITDILDLFPGRFYPVIQSSLFLKYVQLTSRYCTYFIFVPVNLQLNDHNFMNFQQIF